MPSETGYKAWDLSTPVSGLLRILSAPERSKAQHAPDANDAGTAHATQASGQGGNGRLGDFSKIFHFLGTPASGPSPQTLASTPTVADDKIDNVSATSAGLGEKCLTKQAQEPTQELVPLPVEEKKDYTSDGAVYNPPVSKGVRFREWPVDAEFDDLQRSTSHDSSDDTISTAPDATPGTCTKSKTLKNREKKARQRANRRRARAALPERQQQDRATSDVEFGDQSVKPLSKSPARKASVHTITTEPVTPNPTVESKTKKKKAKEFSEDPFYIEKPAQQGQQEQQEQKKKKLASPMKEKSAGHNRSLSSSSLNGSRRSEASVPSKTGLTTTPDRPIARKIPATDRVNVQPSFPVAVRSLGAAPVTSLFANQSKHPLPNFLPYVINPEFYSPSRLQGTSQAISKTPMYQPPRAAANRFTIRHGTDRHEHFFLELLKQFPNDKKWLLSPAAMSNHTTNPEGLHVFVDASNIFIGFYEHLKKLFGIKEGRIEGLQISFDALVLLMERRRPVAKRVIVGSEPHLPAFEMAKSIGYETSILSQVYKDSDISKRQKRHYYQLSSSGQGTGLGGYANASAGPETVAGAGGGNLLASPSRPGDPQKWVEQGVDELIHLKMLESIVDADKPGTMVLATGDAAVAEYSQGFLKMVERALSKGWSVELMGWSMGISKAYRTRAFRKRWGELFRIVELDDFVEDLVDT